MLDILISSRTRRKLVAFFAINPKNGLPLRDLAREIGESPQATMPEVTLLERSGFIFSAGAGRQKKYYLNQHCQYLREIQSLVVKLKASGYKEFNFTDYDRKGLLEKNLNSVVAALISKYRPEKIILFGSLAHGKVNETTDIDLFIIKDTNKKYFDRIREVTSLCDYNVGIDFIVYNLEEFKQMARSRSFVRDEIIKKGKVLYEKAA